MRIFKWLYPGLGFKRWGVLFFAGLLLISFGWVDYIVQGENLRRLLASVSLASGLIFILVAIYKAWKVIIDAFVPDKEKRFVDIVYQKKYLLKGPKIVAIGGGTGLSVILRGLKEYTSNITAIVTVSDSGGSSGRIRKDFKLLPPGDIRNCLVALADAEPLMGNLFQYRFAEESELKGHNFGNLFILAMTKVVGDFEKAVKESSKVLAIRGQVIPSTLSDIVLVAKAKDGSVIKGEDDISKSGIEVDSVALQPEDARPSDEAIASIKNADIIVLGPGSLYTSIIPNLLIKGIKDAVINSKAMKIISATR